MTRTILVLLCLATIIQSFTNLSNKPHRLNRRQIVDGVVKNEGVKPKRPGSVPVRTGGRKVYERARIFSKKPATPTVGRTQTVGNHRAKQKFHIDDRAKKILKGFAIAGLTKLGMAVKHRMSNKHHSDRHGSPSSFMNIAHPNSFDQVCTNSRLPGKRFTCPVETFNPDETLCCGPPGRQWCCNQREFDEVNRAAASVRRSHHSKGGFGILKLLLLIILLPLLFAFILIACACTTMCGMRDMLCGLFPAICPDSNEASNEYSPRFTCNEDNDN